MIAVTVGACFGQPSPMAAAKQGYAVRRQLRMVSLSTKSEQVRVFRYFLPIDGTIHIKTVSETNGQSVTQGYHGWLSDRL